MYKDLRALAKQEVDAKILLVKKSSKYRRYASGKPVVKGYNPRDRAFFATSEN